MRAGPGGAAGIGQEHQGEQTGHLTVRRQQRVHGPHQPDGLVGEIGALEGRADAAAVSLTEDEIEHVQHRGQPLGPLRLGGHAEGNARRLDGRLGPADPLRHRGLGHQEGVGDLRRGEPADRAQGQRDGRRRRERGVTAHEEEHEGVVALVAHGLVGPRGEGPLVRELGSRHILAAAASLLAPDLIRQPAKRDAKEPAARVVGDAGAGPLRGGGNEGVLYRVLRGGEIRMPPGHCAQHPRGELAQQRGEIPAAGRQRGQAPGPERMDVDCMGGPEDGPPWTGRERDGGRRVLGGTLARLEGSRGATHPRKRSCPRHGAGRPQAERSPPSHRTGPPRAERSPPSDRTGRPQPERSSPRDCTGPPRPERSPPRDCTGPPRPERSTSARPHGASAARTITSAGPHGASAARTITSARLHGPSAARTITSAAIARGVRGPNDHLRGIARGVRGPNDHLRGIARGVRSPNDHFSVTARRVRAKGNHPRRASVPRRRLPSHRR